MNIDRTTLSSLALYNFKKLKLTF